VSYKELYVDLETTGLNVQFDRICQIGIVLHDGTEWSTLINPLQSIAKDSTKIHGITDEMVENAPTIQDISDRLIHSLEEADVFIAYNFSFDFQFLQAELYRARNYLLKESKFIFIDPYRIFKKMYPRNLANAYKFYTGKEFLNAHDALEDIKATKEILDKQKEFYADLFAKPLEQVAAETAGDTNIIGKWFEKVENGNYKFRHGKHKGEFIGLEHKSYLKWIYGLDDTTMSEKIFIGTLI
jgi:DNA polymerase-3 subunit epsilon